MSNGQDFIKDYNPGAEYAQGFVTNVETIDVPKGLTEDTVRFISNQKNKTPWLF